MHAVDGLVDRELVARWMVQDVEDLAVADHLADVLPEPRVVELDAAEEQQSRAEPPERVRVGGLHQVLVPEMVRDGEKVVAAPLVLLDQLRGRPDAVREGGVCMQVSAQQRHQDFVGRVRLSATVVPPARDEGADRPR